MRTNWKSKNFNPDDDPTQFDSSTDESEEEVKLERQDSFASSLKSPIKRKTVISNEPELIDISLSTDHPSSRPNVSASIETLQ